ncbi:MAG: anthrone oxygenase family protein [Pseudomonadota bacterium]
MSVFMIILLQLSVLAYALVGGVFLAFSDFIMRSLARTGGTGGVEAMQAINREVFRWVFMALFLGMAAVSAFIVVYSAMNLSGGPGTLILFGALVYLVGCSAVTVVFNVPMNEALDGMEVSSEATRAYWTDTYLPRWTLWNTVRAIACTAAAAMVLFGLIWLPQSHASLVSTP